MIRASEIFGDLVKIRTLYLDSFVSRRTVLTKSQNWSLNSSSLSDFYFQRDEDVRMGCLCWRDKSWRKVFRMLDRWGPARTVVLLLTIYIYKCYKIWYVVFQSVRVCVRVCLRHLRWHSTKISRLIRIDVLVSLYCRLRKSFYVEVTVARSFFVSLYTWI